MLTLHATYFGLDRKLDLRWGIRRTLDLRAPTLRLYAGPTLEAAPAAPAARRSGTYTLTVAFTALDQQRALRTAQIRFVP